MSPTATFAILGSLLAFAVALGTLLRKARLPFLLSYFLTGAILGEVFRIGGLDLSMQLQAFSTFGIVFLLFLVGLRLNFGSLKSLGTKALSLGVLQVAFTATAIALTLGVFKIKPSGFELVFVAVAFSFSSTIVATKIIQLRKEEESLYAKIALGILIVQDLAALILIAAIGLTSGNGGPPALIALAFLIKLIAVFLIVVLSYKFLPKIEALVVKETETLFLFSLAVCLIFSAVYEALGIGMALGALTAGVLLAPSFFQREIASKIEPVKNFFLALFFITLGAKLSLGFLLAHFWIILGISAALLIFKSFLIAGLLKWTGFSQTVSFKTAASLSQISEFTILILVALNLTNTAVAYGTAIFIITSFFSSLLLDRSWLISHFLPFKKFKNSLNGSNLENAALPPEIILFGAHRLGEGLIKSLKKLSGDILVIDNNPEIVAYLKTKKINHVFGDGGEIEFLESLKLNRLQMLVSTIPDLESNLTLAAFLKRKRLTPIKIFLANQLEEAKVLYDNGADYVILPHYLGKEIVGDMIEKRGLNKNRYEILRNRHLKQI